MDQDSDNIICECQTGHEHRPGECSLGDSVCRQSISSVRETIKKYEPNENYSCGHEIKRGSYGSLRSLKSTKSLNNNNGGQPQQIICNTSATPRCSREVINHYIIYDDNVTSSKNDNPCNNNNVVVCQDNQRKSLSGQSNKSNSQLIKKRESNDMQSAGASDIDGLTVSENKTDLKNCDISYQSKTTIAKTSNGVRIITDIFFDSNTEYNWQGSRIETDIPPSKILKDFQEKNQPTK